jgi:putative hemolysin
MKDINIEALIASKSPMLGRWLPRFAVRWLQGLICQNEINQVLHAIGGLQGMDFVRAALHHLGISYTLHGEQHIASCSRALYIANHPLGGLDGIILLAIIGNTFPNVITAVNDLLLAIEPMRDLFVPINKYGGQRREHARELIDACAGNAPIIYFPAGLCSRRYGRVIADPVWKHSAMKIACRYRRSVIPLYFDGRNSNTFYRLAAIRKALGIKVNLETFLLPRELFRQTGRHFDVYAGSPIDCHTLQAMPSFAAMSDYVRSRVYAHANC